MAGRSELLRAVLAKHATPHPVLLALSGAPRRQAIHGLAALDRHPRRSSHCDRCDARRHAGEMNVNGRSRSHIKTTSTAHQNHRHINTVIPANAGIQSRGVRACSPGYRLSPVRRRAFDVAWAVLLILLLLWTLVPLKRAEHRRPWRTGSEGGEAGCRCLFAAPQMARRNAPSWPRSTGHRLAGFCFFGKATQRRGRAFFGYFLCATKKVTRAIARNGSVKPKESGEQATPNPSGCTMKPLS